MKAIKVTYMPSTGRYLAIIRNENNVPWPTVVTKEEAQKLDPRIV